MSILYSEDTDEIEEGVPLDLITQQLSDINLADTIAAINELKEEFVIYSTYDDAHYKLMQ